MGPQGDVWEVCLPDGKQEQFFTYPAAVRELSKASLEFPTAEELEAAAMFADSNDEDAFFALRGSISGFWHAKHATLYDIKTSAYRWHSASKESARGHKTFSAVKNGKLGMAKLRMPSSCAVPVTVR